MPSHYNANKSKKGKQTRNCKKAHKNCKKASNAKSLKLQKTRNARSLKLQKLEMQKT